MRKLDMELATHTSSLRIDARLTSANEKDHPWHWVVFVVVSNGGDYAFGASASAGTVAGCGTSLSFGGVLMSHTNPTQDSVLIM